MMLVVTAALAIVIHDQAALRAAPYARGTELEQLWQGDVVEVRGEHAGYLQVYDHRRERGGYLRADAERTLDLTETSAPDILAVLRFLRDSPGFEALGISYGAAYLKAAPARDINAEPFDAIAQMAERLADRASGGSGNAQLDADIAGPLEVVEQFGVHMQSVERHGRMRTCYDGELFHRVLAFPGAQPEARARAVLGLTRPDCIDPDLDPEARSSKDAERAQLLEQVKDDEVSTMTRSRLRARRAGVWAALAYAGDRGADGHRRESAAAAQERALTELVSIQADALGEDRRGEYVDAVIRVSASRWAGSLPSPQPGPLTLIAVPGAPGQTCVTLQDARRPKAGVLVRRCTYGIVRMASLQTIPQTIPRLPALVFAVQPLESWRELWIVHENAGGWTMDVIPPGLDDPEEGYVDFAGYVPGSRRVLIAREFKDRGRFKRRFEELRLDDLAVVRQASSPELLPDFGRWQDVTWRRDTLTLH